MADIPIVGAVQSVAAAPIPLGRMGCLGCDGTYAVGFLRCPHCGTRSPLYAGPDGMEDGMPTSTSGGASNAWEQAPEVADAAPAAGAQQAAAPEPVEPVEDPSTSSPPAPVEEPQEPATEQPEELSAADVAAGYTDLSYAQLRAEAKARGLSAGGSALDLAARLADHDTAPGTEES